MQLLLITQEFKLKKEGNWGTIHVEIKEETTGRTYLILRLRLRQIIDQRTSYSNP